MTDVIKKEHVFAHPIQKVWDAITKAEEISKWFLQTDFKAEKGFKYTFQSTGEADCTQITGEVRSADPYILIYTWVVQDTHVETVVRWELIETNGGTKLYLEHFGISKYPENSAVTFFNSFNSGWDHCVNDLESFLMEEVNAG